eukprot:gene3152-6202_t
MNEGKAPPASDNKVLECPDPSCRKRFNSCWSLTRHTRTHTGDKPFKCEAEGCGKEFVEKCALRRHEQTHSDQKQWVCPISQCGKKFKLKEYLASLKYTLDYFLDVHKRTHMKDCHSEESVHSPDEEDHLNASHDITKETVLIDQLRQRLMRNNIRHSDEISRFQKDNDRLKRCLKECGFALEIAISLLQSLTHGNVPQSLNDILAKIVHVNQYFNQQDNAAFYAPEYDNQIRNGPGLEQMYSMPPPISYNMNGMNGNGNNINNYPIQYPPNLHPQEYDMGGGFTHQQRGGGGNLTSPYGGGPGLGPSASIQFPPPSAQSNPRGPPIQRVELQHQQLQPQQRDNCLQQERDRQFNKRPAPSYFVIGSSSDGDSEVSPNEPNSNNNGNGNGGIQMSQSSPAKKPKIFPVPTELNEGSLMPEGHPAFDSTRSHFMSMSTQHIIPPMSMSVPFPVPIDSHSTNSINNNNNNNNNGLDINNNNGNGNNNGNNSSGSGSISLECHNSAMETLALAASMFSSTLRQDTS